MEDQKTALILDEILAKIGAVNSAKPRLNPVAVFMTEKLFNDICKDKLVMDGGVIKPKSSVMKKIYGLTIKPKEPTMLPDEQQFSIEVV